MFASEFPSSTFQGVRVLRPPNVSIIDNLGVVCPFFSLFIINNLQRAALPPPKTSMIDGVIPLPSKNPGFQKSADDGISLCPLDPLDETALETSVLQIPATCAWNTHDWGQR